MHTLTEVSRKCAGTETRSGLAVPLNLWIAASTRHPRACWSWSTARPRILSSLFSHSRLWPCQCGHWIQQTEPGRAKRLSVCVAGPRVGQRQRLGCQNAGKPPGSTPDPVSFYLLLCNTYFSPAETYNAKHLVSTLNVNVCRPFFFFCLSGSPWMRARRQHVLQCRVTVLSFCDIQRYNVNRSIWQSDHPQQRWKISFIGINCKYA